MLIWPGYGPDLLGRSSLVGAIMSHMMLSTKASLLLGCIMSLCLCQSELWCEWCGSLANKISDPSSPCSTCSDACHRKYCTQQSHHCTPSLSVHPCQCQCYMFTRRHCQTDAKDRWPGHRNTPESTVSEDRIDGRKNKKTKWQRIHVSTFT